MARKYRMGRRAASREEIRERILRATMLVHDEKGVAPTTFSDVAERAGVGVATVYRHFPSTGALVQACGVHVWQEMRPPSPDTAPAVFAGLSSSDERLARLIDELDAFYQRGAYRLRLAGRDRELVPELHMFLSAVDAGVGAFVAAALPGASERALSVVAAMVSFPVWDALERTALPGDAVRALRLRLLECAIAGAAT